MTTVKQIVEEINNLTNRALVWEYLLARLDLLMPPSGADDSGIELPEVGAVDYNSVLDVIGIIRDDYIETLRNRVEELEGASVEPPK